jgi:hypothetical protein
LSWEVARRIAERFGWSRSEFVRSGMEEMMQEKHPALPKDLVKLYHDTFKEIEAELRLQVFGRN